LLFIPDSEAGVENRNPGPLFPYYQVSRFNLYGCTFRPRCFFPVLNFFTIVFTGKTVFTAEIPATVFTVERKVYPLPAKEAVLVYRRFSLSEKLRKE